jgi:hypothetical protein
VEHAVPQPVFSWHVHPARRYVGRAVVGAVVVAVFATLAAVLMQHPAWAVVAVIILMLMLNRFYFPSRFEIDDEGITARYPMRRQRLRWTDLRWFRHDDDGGYLSTRARPGLLDGSRGMHLLFDGHPGPAEHIREHLPEGVARGAGPDRGQGAAR